MKESIEAGLRDLSRVATVVAEQAGVVQAAAGRYLATLRAGGTLFFAGNGGSAATAQHIATEYVVRFKANRRPFRALALTTDTSVLTAAGNDFGFDTIFSRQVEALAGPADLLIVHSTSGRSHNLVEAVAAARRTGTAVVGMLGGDGGALVGLVDHAVVVPSNETSRIQELHLAIEHSIVELVERELRG